MPITSTSHLTIHPSSPSKGCCWELFLNDHIQSIDAEMVAQAIALLPEWRRERALRFRHLQGQRECALVYHELCRGLQLLYGITQQPTFQYNKHGKPTLVEYPHIHFSLSHCQVGVGCLLSDRPCGLDIERFRTAKQSLVSYTMNEQETDMIYSSPYPDITFTELWTRKEAVLKLLATGITDTLKDILQLPEVQQLNIHTITNPLYGYVISIALSPNH